MSKKIILQNLQRCNKTKITKIYFFNKLHIILNNLSLFLYDISENIILYLQTLFLARVIDTPIKEIYAKTKTKGRKKFPIAKPA